MSQAIGGQVLKRFPEGISGKPEAKPGVSGPFVFERLSGFCINREGSVKALITGIGGFVGGHLARRLLLQQTVEVSGITYFPVDQHKDLSEAGVRLFHINLTDEQAVGRVLAEVRPDHIYHLAAQSFVPESFEDPWGTLSNNILAQLNLLQQMIKLDIDARILVVSSAEIYGPVSPDEVPINELHPLKPPSPYSVSKVAQDMLGLQYFLSHHVAAIRVRPFNQIGPGQSKRFVAPAFASQIAAIEAGQQDPVLYVGNLGAKRDFTDVRDMVRAYELVMQLGEPGDVYNIGSGEAHSIQELLDTLLYLTDRSIEIQVDQARMRPVEVPIIVCDPAKMYAATGWKPGFTFEQTLSDVLDDWRSRIRAGGN
jgi:GDP-4-dehydro-6-deoxy-D-mannose reductase